MLLVSHAVVVNQVRNVYERREDHASIYRDKGMKEEAHCHWYLKGRPRQAPARGL